VDGVIHLAGTLGPACEADPTKAGQVNFSAALSIFQQARTAPLKIVYASTAGVFSETDGMHPDPGSHYGVFKRALELSAQVFYQADGISSVGLRPLTVYGPGRLFGHSAGPSLACRAAARGEPYIHPFTGMTDFLFPDDLARAFVGAVGVNEPGAHRLNLTGDVATVEYFLAVLRQQRPNASISCEGSSLPIAAYRADNGFARLLPDWRPTLIEEGICKTLAVCEAQWREEQGGVSNSPGKTVKA
jgi:nucleoside-diphosphate-sugar epimerase